MPWLRDELTAWLKTPLGTETLWLVQAAAFQDVFNYRGLLAPVRVGGGKTLISFLIGTVLGVERVLLLIPAKLRGKTERALRERRLHWRIPRQILIMHYEYLSRDAGLEQLLAFRPQVIIPDEAHKLKNPRASCVKRLRKYLNMHDDTVYADLSGSLANRSMLEYAHRARWALGEKLSPLPQHYPELADWALATDVKVDFGKRLSPGALAELCNDDEVKLLRTEPVEAARRAYGRRLVETPGVIATDDVDDATCSISIEGLEVEVTDAVRAAFLKLRGSWETPDNEPFSEGVDLWRHARELICGFYYRCKVRPPDAWMQARKDWNAFVRETLKGSRTYFSTLDLSKAISKGEVWSSEYNRWAEIRDTFKPQKEAVWICDKTLHLAHHWLYHERGVCWVEHRDFGLRLARMAGVPFFAKNVRDETGMTNLDPETYAGPYVASIHACREGLNMQHNHHKALVVSCPPGGDKWQQMLGRQHRHGQGADELEWKVLLGCIEQWRAFQQALEDAKYAWHMVGDPQKILLADVDVIDEREVNKRQEARHPLWA